MADLDGTTHFAIIVGTGLVESIVAAALARAGKTVLHIDSNETYGSENRSFNLQQLLSWVNAESADVKHINPVVGANQAFMSFSNPNRIFINKRINWNLTEDNSRAQINEDELADLFAARAVGCVGYRSTEETSPMNISEDAQSPPNDVVASLNQAKMVLANNKEECPEARKNKFLHISRFFSVDLCPKILLAQDPLIKLLVKSDVSRYCEFRLVSKILTLRDGVIEKVPCSRSDVFSSKKLNVTEKRLLMQFISLCLKYEEEKESLDGFEDRPLFEFFEHRGFSPLLIHYINTTFCLANAETTTKKGVLTAARLLKSAGIYGHTPYLWPIYGNGDLSQAFCRLAAVFGAVYHLRMNIHGLIYDRTKENSVESIIYDDTHTLNAKYFIVNKSYFTENFKASLKPKIISRNIVIKSKPLYPEQLSEQSILYLLDGTGNPPTSFIELTYESGCCSKNLFLVYAIAETTNEQRKLDSRVEEVLNASVDDKLSDVVLLTISYDQVYYEANEDYFNFPNLFITQTNPMSCFYQDAVQQAERIFHSILPDEEFLPQAPNPEDIVFENDSGSVDTETPHLSTMADTS